MAFSNNVITNAGRALIAGATAADQIVFREFVASENYYSAAALGSATPSDFEIKGGTIHNASSEGLVARITGKMVNQTTVKTAKSFAIIARLQSQTDSSNVVLAAISDNSANIRIPSTSEPPIGILIPINIAIADSGTIYVTTGSAAAPSDLDRFVSMYSAADSSVGEDQTILGEKYFENNLHANADIYSHSDAYFEGYTEISSAYIGDLGSKDIWGLWTETAPNIQLSLHGQSSHNGLTGGHIEFYTDSDQNGYDYNYIQAYVEHQSWQQTPTIKLCPKYRTGGNVIPSTLELIDLDRVCASDSEYTDLGSSTYPFKKVYAGSFVGNLEGCLPKPTYTSGTTQNFPIGAIFLCYKAYTGQVEVGDTWTITTPDNSNKVARTLGSAWSASPKKVGAGTYMALSESEPDPGNGGVCVILCMRVS